MPLDRVSDISLTAAAIKKAGPDYPGKARGTTFTLIKSNRDNQESGMNLVAQIVDHGSMDQVGNA